jgi:hypothetical protein
MNFQSWIALIAVVVAFFGPLANTWYKDYLSKKTEQKSTKSISNKVFLGIKFGLVAFQVAAISMNVFFVYELLRSSDPLTRFVVFQFTIHIGSIVFIILIMTLTGMVNMLIDLMKRDHELFSNSLALQKNVVNLLCNKNLLNEKKNT